MTSKLLWGQRWPQRIRLYPLYLALRAADLCGRIGAAPAWQPQPLPAWRPGIAVLIPECGTPALLAGTLAALQAASTGLGEPVHVRVIVNGAPAADYASLQHAHPSVEWQFVEQALGFHGAIERGLHGLAADWVYLLNSDMRLHADALRTVLPLRAHDVFAIGSHVLFADPSKRREETGLTGYAIENGTAQLYEALPTGDDEVREHLYPGGGASLYRREVLADCVAASRCYAPFYVEDADWGVLAWHRGLRSLFCAASKAVHEHQATIGTRHDRAQIERIVARNLLWFEARQALAGMPAEGLMERICGAAGDSQREIAAPVHVLPTFRARLAARRRPLPAALAPGIVTHPGHLRGRSRSGRPRLLWVSPFPLLPANHGGARRTLELMRALSAQYEILLLSDEGASYPADAWRELAFCHAIKLIGGRPPDDPSIGDPRLRRMASHSHPHLRETLAAMLDHFQPDLVQIEHVEAAPLIAQRGDQRWVLTLHDVTLSKEGGDTAADHEERRLVDLFDATVTCSAEDQALLAHPRSCVVANGSALDPADYVPSSPALERLLFLGAFRYAPNLVGIRRFLADAWPAILHARPRAQLRIVGGNGAAQRVAGDPLFAQAGVEVLSQLDDLTAGYRDATLCLNPQQGIRGSALKVIEALCAGRVCVSTFDGARGFADDGFDALVRVPDPAAMAAPIIELLADPQRRHARERPDPARLAPYSWRASAERQHRLYQELLA